MTRSALSRRRFLTIGAAMLTAGPAWAQPVTRWRGHALGAEAEITVRGPKGNADAALRAAETELRRIERLFSLYDPQSDLSRLNRTGQLGKPDDAFLDLLRLADRVHDTTGGVFDPSIQPLWHALARLTPGASLPADLVDRIGWAGVQFDAQAVRFARPGMALTFNGIAQGFASDRIAAVLDAHGFTETLVNIGEFRAGAGSWTLGIEDPSWGLVAVRSLSQSAIATSSPGALRFSGSGRSHILHPSQPSEEPGWSSVSVEARNAALADGYSTAFALLSRQDIARIRAREPDIHRVFLVSENGERAELL